MKTSKIKKGDNVRWKIGRAQESSRGTVIRAVKAGTLFGSISGSGRIKTTLEPGDELQFDSAVVEKAGGARVLIAQKYLST
jgi:hypothetical protein